ncbi:MAG: DUF4179 domain-containing protein [Paraclostridium sp.]
MSKLDNIKVPKDFDIHINKSIDKAIEDKKQIKLRKTRSLVAGLSGVILVGSIVLSSESTWAYIDNMTKKIESFFDREESEFDKYKFEGNQMVSDSGLEITLGEVILDDRQLILSMSVDYSKLRGKSKIDVLNLSPSDTTIIIDDLVFTGQSNSGEAEKVEGEDRINMLFRTSLLSIDKDGDGYSETPYEILDKIKSDKDYDLTIAIKEINRFHIDDYDKYNPIEGNWEFKTKINASNILKDTAVYKSNKTVSIDEERYRGDFTIEEVRVSPISLKVKYNYDLYTEVSVNKRRDPGITAIDQDGNELEILPGTGGQEAEPGKVAIGYEFKLSGNEESVSIIPRVYVQDDKPTFYKEGAVDIDLN